MKEKKSIQKTSVTFWESKIKIFEFLGEEAYDIQMMLMIYLAQCKGLHFPF